MDETEDIDPFAYKLLKVTKKRTSVSTSLNSPKKKQKTGEASQRRKSGVRSKKSPLPSQKGPGIVQLFAQMRKTPVKTQKLLSGTLHIQYFTNKSHDREIYEDDFTRFFFFKFDVYVLYFME